MQSLIRLRSRQVLPGSAASLTGRSLEGRRRAQGPRDEPWGMRELALRSPDGHRFMLGQPLESD
jgi:hypothetical protein